MPLPSTRIRFACALLLAGMSAAASAQSADSWQTRQAEASRMYGNIVREAGQHKGLLARYQVMRAAYAGNRDPTFHQVFDQYLSWYQTFLGDYPGASATFSIKQAQLPQDNPPPLSSSEYTARPALEAIPELARNYRAVFFNEAHNVPLTRTLTVQLLAGLRAEGFDYFAVETLSQTDTGLQARGYPVEGSGFYTEEPIYADMVRTALKLGFKVIAYEATSDATGDAREAEQASNLYRQVFQKDPRARLVVNAGYEHIRESGTFLGGASMAEHLHKLTGIDPLTIEQTVLFPHQSAGDDHPCYTAAMQKLRPKVPIIFQDQAGKPWALRAGYDVSVFFPPQTLRHGRPTWLTLGGARKPYFVNGLRCVRRYPCLVEAHHADESPDAIPADRLVLELTSLSELPMTQVHIAEGQPGSELYLRPGKYRLTYTGANGHVLARDDISL
jgi:hypothetical protein